MLNNEYCKRVYEQILAREVDKTVHAAMLEQLKAKL